MTAILLATYQGERYLPELLDSIRRQSHSGWRLLVRDDGSTDGTPALLDRASRDDSRITVVPNEGRRLGIVGNFGQLMRAAQSAAARHIFFADQDDVWLPHKLQWQLEAMQELESLHGAARPALVHSDLAITDGSLRTISRSFAAHARLKAEPRTKLQSLLTHNGVTGCATAINRALLELATPLPAETVMHDWWIALCAAAAGDIKYLNEPLVLYRQHEANAVGARKGRLLPDLRLVRALFGRPGADEPSAARIVSQTFALRQRLAERLLHRGDNADGLIARYCETFEKPASRLRQMLQLHQLQTPVDFVRRVGWSLRVLCDSSLHPAWNPAVGQDQ